MALKVYDDHGDIIVSSDYRRIIVREHDLNHNSVILVVDEEYNGAADYIYRATGPVSVGDTINGVDLINPRIGMVVKEIDTDQIFCFVRTSSYDDNGYQKSVWCRPGAVSYDPILFDTDYVVLAVGDE